MLSNDRMMGVLMAVAVGVGIGVSSAAYAAQSSVGTFFVGIDNATTVPFGTYLGQPNTNAGRLTLLFHHGNHFHGIGTYSYTGDVNSPTPSDTNSNNRLPEGYTGLDPLSLQPGTGNFGGTYRSGLPSSLAQDQEYGDLTLRNVHSLNGVDDVIYNSSGGRWNTGFDNAHIHLELVSATPGLKIAFGNSPTDSLQAGGDIHLGDGDEMFDLLPTFWVDGGAALGSTYTAEFRLTDEFGNYGDSGRFFLDFQVVPEPASAALIGIGGILLLRRRRLV